MTVTANEAKRRDKETTERKEDANEVPLQEDAHDSNGNGEDGNTQKGGTKKATSKRKTEETPSSAKDEGLTKKEDEKTAKKKKDRADDQSVAKLLQGKRANTGGGSSGSANKVSKKDN